MRKPSWRIVDSVSARGTFAEVYGVRATLTSEEAAGVRASLGAGVTAREVFEGLPLRAQAEIGRKLVLRAARDLALRDSSLRLYRRAAEVLEGRA